MGRPISQAEPKERPCTGLARSARDKSSLIPSQKETTMLNLMTLMLLPNSWRLQMVSQTTWPVNLLKPDSNNRWQRWLTTRARMSKTKTQRMTQNLKNDHTIDCSNLPPQAFFNCT